MPSFTKFSQYIKSLRSKEGGTLHETAKGTDIDMTLLSKIERGERLPTFEQAKRLAAHFQIDENELLTKLTAQKILKEYGLNESTLKAVGLVEEQIAAYLTKEGGEDGEK